MQLTARALNRTLLLRQHLLERSEMGVLAMVEHLLGLQAQVNLPPYLSLAARLRDLDPRVVSEHLTSHEVVRLFSMRGTIHLLTPDDALRLRPWVQPFLDRQLVSNQQARPAAHLTRPQVARVAADALADGPAAAAHLQHRLAEAFPEVPSAAAMQVAKSLLPLVQLPPRGTWRRSGGVVHALLGDVLERPQLDVDLPDLVRRWLLAYGPATANDMTTWSGVARLGPVFKDLDLVQHTGPDGLLYDVPDAPLADEDVPAPPRLLGVYDNLWLSHARRDRVLAGEDRKRWMGANGGTGNLVLFDGVGAGLWRVEDGRIVLDLWRRATRAERAGLDEEVARTEALLAVPPAAQTTHLRG